MRHLGEKLSPAIADTHKSATRDRRRIFHYRLRIHPLRKPPFSHCPETARSKSSPQGPTKPHDCRSAILPLSMPSRDRSCSDPAHLYRRREYPLACQRAGKGSKQIELLRRLDLLSRGGHGIQGNYCARSEAPEPFTGLRNQHYIHGVSL